MANRADIRAKIQRELRDPDGNSWSDAELNDLINAGIDAVSDLSPRELREDITYTFPETIVQGSWGKIKEITLVNPFTNIFRVEILDNNSRLHTSLPRGVDEGSSSGWEWFNNKVIIPENWVYPSEYVTASGVLAPVISGSITGITFPVAGTVRYLCTNAFGIGDIVTITGILPATHNLAAATVTAATSSYFQVSSGVASAWVSGGLATVTAPLYERIKVRVYGYARHTQLDNDTTVATLDDQEQVAVQTYAVANALSRLMTDRANFQQWQIASGSSDMTISELGVLSNAARQRWYAERTRIRKMRRLG